MSELTPYLQAVDVGRRVAQRPLLDQINLTVRQHDRLVVYGPSGSGKSLLLRSLALFDEVDCGRILWTGRLVDDRRVPEFRSQVMYLPQRAALLEGSVEANLQRPFQFRCHSHRQYRPDQAARRLERLGRSPAFLQQSVRNLSGGEQQIVALLRALQLDPTLLLLDEPTASLDPAMTSAVETLVVAWLDESPEHRGLVWVTHDADQMARIGRRTGRMEHGKLFTESSA